MITNFAVAKYDVGDRVVVKDPNRGIYTILSGVYEAGTRKWYYEVTDHDRYNFQVTEDDIVGKVSDGSALQDVAQCLPNHKYSFAEYLRGVCESAGGDCLKCKLMTLGYASVEPGGAPKRVCDVLQSLFMNNNPRAIAKFVAGVVAFADEDDKKSED